MKDGKYMVVTDYRIEADYNMGDNYCTAADVPKAFTIALIADLHDRSWETIFESMYSQNPNIIAITGDLVTSELTDNCISFLSACASITSTFYSLGNHETRLDTDDFTEIRKTGAILLDDAAVHIGDVTIGGLSSGYRFQREQLSKEGAAGGYSLNPEPNLSWLKMFSGLPGFKVLLCHHSEYYPRYIRQTDIHITLAGHAHGGQIRLGSRGLFAPNQGFFPKWTSGVHDDRLVISRGLANTAGRIPRFGNPTELVYVRIGREV